MWVQAMTCPQSSEQLKQGSKAENSTWLTVFAVILGPKLIVEASAQVRESRCS